jgi:hypothetical protein
MRKSYKGMNFQEWCKLDNTDERKINYTLNYTQAMQPITTNFTSEDEVDAMMMHRVQNSSIEKIELINNEWFVILSY